MRVLVIILVGAALNYKLYAVPLGLIFAFFVTRRQIGKRRSSTAVWITLGWTVGLFAPLVMRSQSFFNGAYAPWYLALLLSPTALDFNVVALCIAAVTSLMGIAAALYFCER